MPPTFRLNTYTPPPPTSPWLRAIEPPGIQNAWLEDQIDDQWMVAFRLAVKEGQPVVAEVRIFPFEPEDPSIERDPGEWSAEQYGIDAHVPAGGVTARLLKRVLFKPLDSIPDVVGLVQTRYPHNAQDLERVGLRAGQRGRPRPGPRGPDDITLARYARDYIDLVTAGERHPITALVKRHDHSPDRMRDLIHEARDRGLLTSPPVRGKAGGRLTALAIAMLQAADGPER